MKYLLFIVACVLGSLCVLAFEHLFGFWAGAGLGFMAAFLIGLGAGNLSHKMDRRK
jgi:hypothetical protein